MAAGRDAYVARRKRGDRVRPEAAFCAEVVALTMQEMGLVADDRRAQWFDPGTFWSGATCRCSTRGRYGVEVKVGDVPDDHPTPSSRHRWR